MLIPTAAEDGVPLGLRASVDAALPATARAGLSRPGSAPGPSQSGGRRPRRWVAVAPRTRVGAAMRGATRTAAGVGALAALLAGCARDAEPQTFAVPAAAAARIRMLCPPGTFVGTMTANCPQPLPRRPPADQ